MEKVILDHLLEKWLKLVNYPNLWWTEFKSFTKGSEGKKYKLD